VYSFGQLLTHPIINALDESPFAWLHTLLRTFNAGDIAGYDSLCRAHADALNGQPALVANERRLREKITIMALLDLIWGLPAEERRIPLAAIGSRTQLSADGVEFLLMKVRWATRVVPGHASGRVQLLPEACCEATTCLYMSLPGRTPANLPTPACGRRHWHCI
jgi:hypothetical protein